MSPSAAESRASTIGLNARALRQVTAALDYFRPLGIEMRVVALHDTMASIALEAADHDTRSDEHFVSAYPAPASGTA